MKVSFPYMGCVTGYEKLMELLGHEVIPPHKPTQRTVDLGVLHSPEFICYPFKVMMGTYIEACEQGAELIVSSGGSGPCRAGLYGEVHKKTLKQMGYDVDVVIFDSMFEDFSKFYHQILQIKNKTPLRKVAQYARLVYNMICQMDELEKELKVRRAYEINKDEFNRCWDEIVKLYKGCYNMKDLKAAHKKAWEMFDAVPMRKVAPEERTRIGIVGEIYVIMESSTNLDMEQRLNDMGVEVTNVQYISEWVQHNILPRKFNKSESWKMWDKAEQYKSCNCGGHDMENTGRIIDFAEKGYDGVIHLMPFGCLPELITRSMIPQLSEELNIPILSVSMDEQLGEANLQTRLEAFVDLCRSKKHESVHVPENAAQEQTAKQTTDTHRKELVTV